MNKEEIRQAAQKEFVHQLDIGSKDALSVQEGFIMGAEWMQERMIEKAVEWLDNELMFRDHSSGRGSFGEVKAMGGYDSLEEFIDEFKQAMEE